MDQVICHCDETEDIVMCPECGQFECQDCNNRFGCANETCI